MRTLRSAALLFALLAVPWSGCDRNVEPFVPGEKPSAPDLSKIFPPGAEQAARPAMGAEAAAPPDRGAPPAAAAEASTNGPPIRGTITLAPELASRVPPGAVLFLVARRGGSGPPLAVKRTPQPSFPLEFELGPADRMIESIPFSGPLQLSARVDADGNATTRSPGDLQGTLANSVDPGADGIMLVIDQVL